MPAPENAQHQAKPSPADGIPAPEHVRRILVCQLRQIGDVLLSTPSLELLKKQYHNADIHMFTEKKCLPMLENNPHIHKIWPLDKKAVKSPLREFVYYREIAAEKFDLVVDFQQLPRCRSLVSLTKAVVRLSFPPPWYLRHLYTHWSQPAPVYAAAHKAGVLAPLGIAWQGERPRLYLADEERVAAKDTLTALGLGHKRFISVDATHRHATRRWPARHYAALMDMLAEKLPDCRFFLPFGPGEEEEIHALRALCRHKDRVAVPASLLSLREMAACMAQARLQFGNCSSPRHMAVALDVPTLTVLGSTSPGWTFPSPEHGHIAAGQYMPMPCGHCNQNTCSQGLTCLENLSPELILPRVLEHLDLYCSDHVPTEA